MTRPQNSRTYSGLNILNAGHSEIRRLKVLGHIPEIHGHKFWNSSFLMMRYLKKHPLQEGTRVLEIGCGWGLLGIFCAKEFNARVTGADLDPNVFPFLDLHARINGVKVQTLRRGFEQLTVKDLSNYDVILGADVCFWDQLSPVLYNLIRRSLRAGVQQILIGDPSRSPFNELADRCVDELHPVEIIERRMTRPIRARAEILVVGEREEG
jgi:predicted nicotinamide N-methyase